MRSVANIVSWKAYGMNGIRKRLCSWVITCGSVTLAALSVFTVLKSPNRSRVNAGHARSITWIRAYPNSTAFRYYRIGDWFGVEGLMPSARLHTIVRLPANEVTNAFQLGIRQIRELGHAVG